MKHGKTRLAFAVALLSVVVGLMAALTTRGRVRTVDIIQLFFGGLGAGAAFAVVLTNLRRPRPSIFPALKYRDAPAAIAWLQQAFSFAPRLEMAGPDGSVAHAELTLGPGVLMLGSVGRPDPSNPWTTTPGVYVYVRDIDPHYARARAAGATIVRELHDTSYGAREYSAKDLEGQLWSFGTYHPDD